MNFANHFFRNDTPHTREHQQVGIRSFDRKHLNQVPRSKSQQANHPLIDQLIKNDRNVGRKVISKPIAESILKQYHIKFSPGERIVKSINRTGISITYDPIHNVYTLIKTKNG